MSKELEPLKEILHDFLAQMKKKEEIWKALGKNIAGTPGFGDEDIDPWPLKEACYWIHGATDPYEAMELEKWLYHYPSSSITQNSKAWNHYREWEEFIREEGAYTDFRSSDLKEPERNETLGIYIERLAKCVEKHGWGDKKDRRALKSFLHYLRNYHHNEEIAFIEHIFPEKNDLKASKIIRRIRPQVNPISQEAVACILKELAHQAVNGRENAKHHAMEALALSWLCLLSSKVRLPKKLEQIHAIQAEALVFTNSHPDLMIPTLFGNLAVRASERHEKFFQAIAMIPSQTSRTTILSTSLPDLRKPLNTAIKRARLPSHLGEISFLPFCLLLIISESISDKSSNIFIINILHRYLE